MKIICVNIERGIYAQYYHILQMLSDVTISVLCVIEPKLNKNDYVPEFESFKAFYVDKFKMIVYVRQNIGLHCVPIWQGMPCFLVRGNQVSIAFAYSEFTKMTLGGSRKVGKKERLTLIKDSFEEILRVAHTRILAMGDFNFDYLKKENCTYIRQFLNFFKRNGFENNIDGITRFAKIEGQEDSQLDYCWTRNLIGKASTFMFSNSDHMGICFEIPSNETIRKNPKIRTTFRETEEMKRFLKDNKVPGKDNFNEEMAKPLEENFEELEDYLKKMRKTMKVESSSCKLDVPWWNNKLATLKRLVKKEKNIAIKKNLQEQYVRNFNYFHKKWTIKNVTSKKHPFPKSKGEQLSRLVIEGKEITSDEGLTCAMRDAYIEKVQKNFQE